MERLGLQPAVAASAGLPCTTGRPVPTAYELKSSRSVKAHAQKSGVRKNGYFSDADPNAPLRSPLDRFKDGTDVTKRGGRYKSDFIWNTNWQEQMKFEEEEEARRKEAAAKPAERPSGFLNFSRLEQLGSLGEDLSELLRPRQQPACADDLLESVAVKNGKGPVFDKIKATHGEQRRWQRQDKFNRVAGPRGTTAPPAVTESLVAASRATSSLAADYENMKAESLLWSLVLVALCSAATTYFYSQEVAASYVLGAVGGLVYLRLLHKSLDSLGGGGSAVGGIVSNQRLLVPIILVMAFNRWNTLAADRTGLTLQLLPVLIGFFTYKAALVARQSVMLLDELSGKRPVVNR